MRKIHFIWMHIFIFIHFQSPAHVGDLTIQHSIREKNIFDILLYNGIRKYCALVVELNIWRPSMRFMNWTYSQWILNQYHMPRFDGNTSILFYLFRVHILKRPLELMSANFNRIDSWSDGGRARPSAHKKVCIKNGRQFIDCKMQQHLLHFVAIMCFD